MAFPESLNGWQVRNLNTAGPVPSANPFLREFILDRLRLPIEVPSVDGQVDLESGLVRLWKQVVEKLEVDGESHWIEPDPYASQDYISAIDLALSDPEGDSYGTDDLNEDQATAHNIARWYEEARAEFLCRTRLIRAPIAGPVEYPKHFPDAACRSLGDLRDRSRHSLGQPGISKLLFGIDKEKLSVIVLLAAADYIDELSAVDASLVRGYVHCMDDIGFTEGMLTQLLCIEWSPNLTHAYPIQENDAHGKVVYLDDLQGVGRDPLGSG